MYFHAVRCQRLTSGEFPLLPLEEILCLFAILGLAGLPVPMPPNRVAAQPPVSLIDRPLPVAAPPNRHFYATLLFASMRRSRSWRSNLSLLSRSTVGMRPRWTLAFKASFVSPK